MANGLDRLERLFSKGKKSAANRHTADSHPNGSPEPPSPPLRYSSETLPPNFFPPTPFIRPKANVMQPRNELTRSSVDRCDSPRSPDSSSTMSPASDTSRYVVDESPTQSYPSTTNTTPLFHIPSRTSSLLARRHDRLPGGLAQLHIPRDPTFCEPRELSSMFPDAITFSSKHDNSAACAGLLDPLPIYPATRVETPPPSDQDELGSPSPPQLKQKLPTALRQLTPEASPEMTPLCDSPSSASESNTEIKRYTTASPTSQRSTPASVPLLEDLWRDSYVCEVNNPVNPQTKVVLRNPSLQEFLAMEDDDLAELRTTYPSRPPPRRAPPPPVLPPNPRLPASPLNHHARKLLSPSVAASQVAAWEAARIAKKFDFDVVYVANFWPSQTNFIHQPSERGTTATLASSPVSTSSSLNSPSFTDPNISLLSSPVSNRFPIRNRISKPRNSADGAVVQVPPKLSERPLLPMTDCCPDSGKPLQRSNALKGCLLAAYGLETIVAPFKLSTRVHKKILRTQGWIEHRNSAAKENEFARGYALSFYTGTTPSPQAVPCTSKRLSSSQDEVSVQRSFASKREPVLPQQQQQSGQCCMHSFESARSQKVVNRGLVFVAYRRPRGPHGSANSSSAELDALGKEAKALVDLILDFHVETRQWNSASEI